MNAYKVTCCPLDLGSCWLAALTKLAARSFLYNKEHKDPLHSEPASCLPEALASAAHTSFTITIAPRLSKLGRTNQACMCLRSQRDSSQGITKPWATVFCHCHAGYQVT